MIHDPELLDQLQRLEPGPWKGRVFRYMFGDHQPNRANTRGARWNPPNVAAIYAAADRDTLLAELEYRLSLDVVRPSSGPRLYTIEVKLREVLDLSSKTLLGELGLTDKELSGIDYAACQALGGAVAWLEHDGLLVPSARGKGVNIVIYTASQSADAKFEVIETEELSSVEDL